MSLPFAIVVTLLEDEQDTKSAKVDINIKNLFILLYFLLF